MCEVSDFLQAMLACPPVFKISYQDAFQAACALDPFTASLACLRATITQHSLADVLPATETDADQYLFLLMSHVVEPFFAKHVEPVAIYGFPPSQAALAQVREGVAERFEVYYRGVELANGFHELTDVKLQQARFSADNQQRLRQQLPTVSPDPHLIQALAHGIPPCSGVALGIERLLALAWQKSSIEHTMAFDFSRA